MRTKQRVPLLVSKMQREIDRARGIEQHEKDKYNGAVETWKTKTGKSRIRGSGPYPILFRQKDSTVTGFRKFC